MKATDEEQTRLRSAEAEATLQHSGTEVRTLVRTEPEAAEDTAARTLKAGRPIEEPGHQGPLEPGSVIKQRFVLERMLGKGGMGLVFGAVDRRKLEARDPNPHVALKVLN